MKQEDFTYQANRKKTAKLSGIPLIDRHPHVSPERHTTLHRPDTRALLVDQMRDEGSEELLGLLII